MVNGLKFLDDSSIHEQFSRLISEKFATTFWSPFFYISLPRSSYISKKKET